MIFTVNKDNGFDDADWVENKHESGEENQEFIAKWNPHSQRNDQKLKQNPQTQK